MSKKTFFGKLIRSPKEWLPQLAMGALAPVTGGLSLLGAAGYGAYRGYQGGGLGGALLGGLGGYGLGGVGAGLGGAISGIAGRMPGTSLLGAAATGFKGGFGAAMQPAQTLLGKLGIGGAAAGAPGTVATARAGAGGIAGLMGMGTKQLLGAGLLGASALMKGAQPPAYGDITRRYVGEGAKPTSELAGLARGTLTDILKGTPEDLYPAATDEYLKATTQGIQRSFDEAIKNTTIQYQQYGKLYSTEHLGAIQELEARRGEEIARAGEESNERRYNQAMQDKRSALQQSLNISNQEMQLLLQGDIAQATAYFNAKQADVESIRQALGYAGGMLLSQPYQTGGGAYAPYYETA